MNEEDFKGVVIAYINAHSVSSALKAIAEIIEAAVKNQPWFGWAKDARLIRSIIPKIEN
jgi:hypothetical protein